MDSLRSSGNSSLFQISAVILWDYCKFGELWIIGLRRSMTSKDLSETDLSDRMKGTTFIWNEGYLLCRRQASVVKIIIDINIQLNPINTNVPSNIMITTSYICL